MKLNLRQYLLMDNYQLLLNSLAKAKKENMIIPLYRGVSKEFAFEKVNLDIKHNTIEQFAKKLFFYGEKSKHFWNDKINSPKNKLEFDINDTSDEFFEYIFMEFNKLIKRHHNNRTSYYFKKNKKAVLFFEDLDNIKLYVDAISNKTKEHKVAIRNYYLTILHQLGESKYKKGSQFISASTEETVTNIFSNGEIVIQFWELNFNKENIIIPDKNIPTLKGKPYKNQKELSIFTVILPHFIYSFKYLNRIYKNPAINNIINFESVPITGLDIKQENFIEKLKYDTNYSIGISTNSGSYQEIN